MQLDEWQDAEGVGVDGVDHDGDEVDLTGLMESIVDSDEEEDLAESIDVMIHFPSHFLIAVRDFGSMEPIFVTRPHFFLNQFSS